MSLFGQLVGNPDVERTLVALCRTWLPTYLREIERQKGLRPGILNQPPAAESYYGGLDFESFIDNLLPSIVAVVNPASAPEKTASAGYGEWFEVRLGAIVHHHDEDHARFMAGYYGTALKGLILQVDKPALFTQVEMTASPMTEFVDPDDRRFARSIGTYRVFVQGTIDPTAGPTGTDPPSSPYYPGDGQPWPDFPTVTEVDVTVTAVPLNQQP